MRILSLSFICLLTACGKSSFSAGTARESRKVSTRTPQSEPVGKDTGKMAPSESDSGTKKTDGTDNPLPGTDPNSTDSIGALSGNGGQSVVSGRVTLQEVVPSSVCDPSKTKAKIFIVDLKSGWFAGDGGDTFRNFVFPNCPERAEVVYVHATNKIVEGSIFQYAKSKDLLKCPGQSLLQALFQMNATQNSSDIDGSLCEIGDLSDFTQIWVLSGSSNDLQDVKLDSPLFVSLTSRLGTWTNSQSASKQGIFLGSGLDNVTHANALAVSLPLLQTGGKDFFALHNGNRGDMPLPAKFRESSEQLPLKAGTGLAAGTFNSSLGLFSGLTGVPDYRKGNISRFDHYDDKGEPIILPLEPSCYGNSIEDSNVTIHATDICGRKTIGHKDLSNGLRVFLEGNMARYYTTKPEDMFNRVVNFLSTKK
jgi:hypothetical protein